MAQKTLWVTSTSGDQRMVSVVDTTTVKEILQKFQTDDVQGRQAALIQGVTLLEPDMMVREAGLEDGTELSVVWSDLFVEMARWSGGDIGKGLYVRIPPETTSIDARAFCNCTALVKIVIPNSVTSIGDRAFYGCSSLTEVEIPDSVTRVGTHAFSGCSSLTQVTLPNSVTTIADRAFHSCSSLTRVRIPNSVTSIGDSAFADCCSLTEVEIPNSVTSIEVMAFLSCPSLTQVEIPESVTRIGQQAFGICPNLEVILMGHAWIDFPPRELGCWFRRAAS